MLGIFFFNKAKWVYVLFFPPHLFEGEMIKEKKVGGEKKMAIWNEF